MTVPQKYRMRLVRAHMDYITCTIADIDSMSNSLVELKGNRKRWSVNGANNMAKLLYRKENKELAETVNRYAEALIFNIRLTEIITTLNAAKAPKRTGKGIHI